MLTELPPLSGWRNGNSSKHALQIFCSKTLLARASQESHRPRFAAPSGRGRRARLGRGERLLDGFALDGPSRGGLAGRAGHSIAADIDELARTRRVQDLNTAAVLTDPLGLDGL